MSTTDDLIAFWSARLDEAEEIAKAVRPKDWDDIAWAGVGATATAHAAANDPASVLADVAADRALLGAYEKAPAIEATGIGPIGARPGLAIAIRHRAARFSGHPGYRESWKP